MVTRIEVFGWSCWVNAGFSFAMLALVLFSRPLNRTKLYWGATCISVGCWSIGLGVLTYAHDYNSAYKACILLTVFSIWIPTFLFHMVQHVIQKLNKTLLFPIYSIAITLSLLTIMGKMIDVRPILDFPYYTSAKSLYILNPIFLNAIFILSGFQIWKTAASTPAVKKKKLLFLLAGIELGFLGGQFAYLLVFNILIFPWGVIFVPVYVILVGYSMMRHQLMDFKLAVKKLSLSLTIYVSLAILLAPFVYPSIQKILNRAPDLRFSLFILIIIYTLAIALGGIIYALLVHRSFWLKSHMTMGLTHELKSPLASIRGAIDYLSTELEKAGTSQKKPNDYLDIIKRNTIRLEVFVNDLLNLANIQDDSVTLDKKKFSLLDTIKTVGEIYEPLIKQKGLLLEIQKGEGDFFLHADEEKIRQVFSNLLSNALKFSDEGKITIQLSQKDDIIECSVSDEGRGISKENLEKVFDRFFQESRATKGSGLGLAIAKAWVEAHGGNIWIESNHINRGSKISFNIPTN